MGDGTYANCEDPDQTPHKAPSDQGCTVYYLNLNQMKIQPDNPKIINGLVQLIRMENFIRLKWVCSMVMTFVKKILSVQLHSSLSTIFVYLLNI